MKTHICALFTTLALFTLLAPPTAHAGILQTGKAWLTGEVLAFLASALLALIGGAAGLMFRKIARTFREAGEFLSILGEAIEDSRLTREELAQVIKEGKEMFGVWR